MQEAGVGGVVVALHGLQVVALLDELGDVAVGPGQLRPLELGERGLLLLRAHVGPDQVALVLAGVGLDLDLALVGVALGRCSAGRRRRPSRRTSSRGRRSAGPPPRCGRRTSARRGGGSRRRPGPTLPLLSRKAMRSSPRMRTRTGGQSGPASSWDRATGSQKRRNSSPMGVPGLVLVISSLSSLASIRVIPSQAMLFR